MEANFLAEPSSIESIRKILIKHVFFRIKNWLDCKSFLSRQLKFLIMKLLANKAFFYIAHADTHYKSKFL
jgi:hypothetical protein